MSFPSKNGLSNQAYEDSTVPTVCATVPTDSTSSGIYVRHEQGKNNSHSSSVMSSEDIKLQDIESYQHLCSCQEKGGKCQCSSKSNALQRISLESWSRCKMIAIALIVGLIGVWLVVYVTLSQLKKL